MADRIDVVGLRDLQRELRAIDKAWARELQAANKTAAELVADTARSRAMGKGGVAAKSAASIRPRAEQRSASILLGGARYPFALGAEFGAIRYRQFEPWRGNQFAGFDSTGGYFLHPAIRDKADEVVDRYGDLIDKLAARAFPS